MLELRDLTFSFVRPDGSPATESPTLNRVNLEVAAGKFILVCGPTGSGKSTLLKVMNGLAPSFTGGKLSGEVFIGGKNLTGKAPHEYAEVVGFVNQQPEGSFVADRVVDEIVYAAEQLGVDVDTISKNLAEITKILEIEELLDRNLDTLSGGQQQRVAIASALIAGQKILLLDEPTSALDQASASKVLVTLKELAHKHGVTVLLAEHRISRVISQVDQLLVVNGDGSVSLGPVQDQFKDARFAPPIIELGLKLGWEPLEIKPENAGKRWQEAPRSFASLETRSPSERMLQLKDVSVCFGDLVALAKTDLDVYGNQITAVMGENGSGKTTLCWAIQGLGEKTTGKVIMAEGETADLAKASRLDLIAMVPQRAADLLFLNSLAEEFSESDSYANKPQGTTSSLFQKLAGRIDSAIHPRDLSAGQQLALVLSIQLAKSAKVLILDEPTRGLDYAAKRALASQLKQLMSPKRSIILASHDVEFVALVADRVVVLENGVVVRDETVSQALNFDSPLASQIAQITRADGLIRLEQVSS
jgi:energy-coupling factor transport system ATP-binding protein